jgi:outer membrane lipoprotein-sorting protein
VTNDGRFRLELQSQGGDAQIGSDGKTVTVFDANSNTAYKFDMPQDKKRDAAKSDEHKSVTLAQVDKAITEISKHWTLSGANPTTTAGQPSYTVRVSPKDDGGLLGAAEVAWDANNGVPLRAAIYADNQDSPVLELKADDISFASVPESDVTVSAPADAKVVDMSSRQDEAAGKADAAHRNGKREAHKAQTVDEVQGKVGFPLAAPDSLAGLPRQGVRTVEHGDGPAGAVVVYGKGLGAIVVLQQDAKAAKEKPDAKGDGEGGHRSRDLELPTININGVSGQELATALGTVVTFERNGVSYTVAGSVPPQAAETAARELQ